MKEKSVVSSFFGEMDAMPLTTDYGLRTNYLLYTGSKLNLLATKSLTCE